MWSAGFRQLSRGCLWFMLLVILSQFDYSDKSYIVFTLAGFLFLVFGGLGDHQEYLDKKQD